MGTPGWIGWVMIATLGLGQAAIRADVVQWRPAVSARVFHHGKFEAILYEETWFNSEGPNPAFVQLSPRFRYHLLDHLTLGLNYSFVDSRAPQPEPDDEWIDQHRIECEVNPHWEWKNGWRLLLRNRLEVRWIEGRPDENWRSRHLVEVGYPIHLPRPIQGVFTSGEFFYDWSAMRNSENRFSPLGFDLGLATGVSLRVYYTWREVEAPDGWTTSHLFWTVLNLKL